MGKKIKPSVNNIWNKKDFTTFMTLSNNRIIAPIRYIARCTKWSWQRIVRGYADCDRWSMDRYLETLIPEMLQDLRDNRQGSPASLGKNYVNSEGMVVNDTCHEEWDNILNRMIYLWREANEDTCSMENPFKEEYYAACIKFENEYGFHGEKLRSNAELERMHEKGTVIIHHMEELPEYKELCDKYKEQERRIIEYQLKSKDEALDMLKEYFYFLWD